MMPTPLAAKSDQRLGKATKGGQGVPPAHKGYSREAAELWRAIVEEWALEPPALALLDVVCRSLQRLRSAEALIARDGLVVKDRFGQGRANPACAIARDSAMVLMSAIKSINLDIEPLHDRPGRPPKTIPLPTWARKPGGV